MKKTVIFTVFLAIIFFVSCETKQVKEEGFAIDGELFDGANNIVSLSVSAIPANLLIDPSEKNRKC